jgi:hypothetical protein
MTNAAATTTLNDKTTVLAKTYRSRITGEVDTVAVKYMNRKQAEARLGKLQDAGIDNAWVYQPGLSVCFFIAFD